MSCSKIICHGLKSILSPQQPLQPTRLSVSLWAISQSSAQAELTLALEAASLQNKLLYEPLTKSRHVSHPVSLRNPRLNPRNQSRSGQCCSPPQEIAINTFEPTSRDLTTVVGTPKECICVTTKILRSTPQYMKPWLDGWRIGIGRT
jgi:hypothetical protein